MAAAQRRPQALPAAALALGCLAAVLVLAPRRGQLPAWAAPLRSRVAAAAAASRLGRRARVLLAIQFNTPPHEGVPQFLHGLYSPHVERIVLLGPPLRAAPPDAAPPSGAIALLDGVDYLACEGDCNPYTDAAPHSQFGYVCAAQLFTALAGYDGHGFLCVHDDVAWRLSVLDRLPLGSTWFLPPWQLLDLADLARKGNRMEDLAIRGAKEPLWWWWAVETNCGPLEEVPVPAGLLALQAAWAELPPAVRAHFDRKWGGRCPTRQVPDAFYVAKQHAAAFAELAGVDGPFRRNNVFMEVATPIILEYVAGLGPGPPVELAGHWLWGEERAGVSDVVRQEAAAGQVDFIHPLKCSKPEAQELMRLFFYS